MFPGDVLVVSETARPCLTPERWPWYMELGEEVFGCGDGWGGLTEAGGTVQGHVPDHPCAKTGPHQEELLGHLLQGPLPLGSHLQESERLYEWLI